MKRMLWMLVAVLALALALPAAATQGRGRGQGKGKPAARGHAAQKGKREKAPEKAQAKRKEKGKKEAEEQERARQAAQGWAFGKDHEKMIRDWFANKKNLEGLPPGLAKRDELPPGLQRHLEKNGTLPPGLQKRIQPLPQDLESKLPKTPEGVKRVVVAGNVILLEERTSKVLDIVKDVFGRSSRSSTGVRRIDR